MTSPSSATLNLPSLAATRQAGRAVAPALPPRAIVLCLGPLGAGKTTLIKSLCEGLGIPPQTVISPTYTLVNIYPGPPAVYHVDFFRVDSPEALLDMDRGDWLNPDGPTFIEWPQAALPWLEGEPCLRAELTPTGADSRTLSLSSAAKPYSAVFDVLERLQSRRAARATA